MQLGLGASPWEEIFPPKLASAKGEEEKVMLVRNSLAKLLLSVGMTPVAITTASAQVPSPALAAPLSQPAISARDLGVTFLPGSASQFVIERNGKRYLVDL